MEGRLVTPANGITVFRLGLFVVFVGLLHQGKVLTATVLLVLAWGLDAVDGWVARTFHHASEVGSLFDKSADRIMLPAGALAALAYGAVPASAILIFMKDWVGLLLILWRERGPSVFDFGRLGKLVTLLEGITLAWMLLALPFSYSAIGVTAVTGGMVGLRQVVKAIRYGV